MSDSQRQAGALTGLEITPEMIEAGRVAYWDHDVEGEGSEPMLRAVFAAMRAAQSN